MKAALVSLIVASLIRICWAETVYDKHDDMVKRMINIVERSWQGKFRCNLVVIRANLTKRS